MTIARWAQALISRRGRLLALAVAIVASSGVWLFQGEDDRGKTARLSADAWYYHAYLPSLALDRDLDLTPQYAITGNWYRLGDTELGRPSNVFGIGPAVLSAPFFLVGHGYARVTGHEANGFSRPEVVASVAASWIASLAALIPVALLIRRRLGGENLAWLVPVLIAAAGPVIYYALRQPGYAHPFATLLVAWLVERWDASFRGGGDPRPLKTWLVLGALIGASTLARPQCALWGVILLGAAGDDVWRVLRGGAGGAPLRTVVLACAPRWLAGAALSLLVFAPQLLAWKAMYGAYFAVPQGAGFMWWGAPAWSEVLFSSRNGLFPWAPLYALAGLGLLLSARRTPRVGLALLAGVALQAIANGAVWDWWAGGSFGGRRFDSSFIAFGYGLAALVVLSPAHARARDWPARMKRIGAAAALTLAIVLAVANILLAATYSAPSARIDGGEPASEVIADRIPWPLGELAGAASRAANAPARWLFSWHHGAGRDAYDRVVGVHYLGELYPGLNSFRGRTREAVPLGTGGPHVLEVTRAGCERCVAMTGGSARVLIGLNRRDEIRFELRAAAPPGRESAHLELWLNGELVGAGDISEAPTVVEGKTFAPRRGVNALDIRAPAGTELHRLHVRGTTDPRGREND